ncbi:hypothetical protein, partial [Klebsiella pneumoniae]
LPLCAVSQGLYVPYQFWKTGTKKRQHIGSLKVEHPLTIPHFFIIGGDCRYFSEKGLDPMSLFSLNNFS